MNDPYRVLGVIPTADEAVIRAAYLALMKRYHPDQPGADVERAKEVAAAYKLLNDPARRAAFDRARQERRYAHVAGAGEAAPRRQTGRTAFYLLSVVTAGLLYVAVTRPLPGNPESQARTDAPALAQDLASRPAPQQPQQREVAMATAESVLPASPQPQPQPQPAPLPVEAPRASPAPLPSPLPLPRTPAPVRVEMPRPAVRPAPAPPQRLAQPAPTTRTARPGQRATQPQPQPQPPSPPVRTAQRPTPAPTAAAAPRGSGDLSALERHQVILYNQSFLAGNQERRSRLLKSRESFLKRLEACTSDACKRDAYLSRNQEIARIMGS